MPNARRALSPVRSAIALVIALGLSASFSVTPLGGAGASELDDGVQGDSPRGEIQFGGFDAPAPPAATRFDGAGTTAAPTGVISGRLQATDGVTTGTPEAVELRRWQRSPVDGEWYVSITSFSMAEDGTFTITQRVDPGEYRFEARFVYNGIPGKVYWPGTDFFPEADSYTLVDGEPLTLPTATGVASWPAFDRIAGVDRFDTSAALSREVIPDGERAPVVYLVNGTGFADALSAGPAAAARGGVLLLTGRNSIPAPIQSELERIDPLEIIIVGGTGAVSSAVEIAARAYVDDPGDVRRLAGSDRYATSLAVVTDALASQPANTPIWIATGRTFPDALAAGPAAAHLDGQVLLIDGASIGVSAPVMALLKSHRPTYITVVGGPGAVTEGAYQRIFIELQALYTPSGQRLAGRDRYETAEAINDWAFEWSGFDVAYIATGTGFADALAGSTTAAAARAPIYLSRPSCLSVSTYEELVAKWSRVAIAIGGTGALSDRVLYGDLC